MGKHDKKVGKGRLDKWYQLAKEQGYRARSAFKLVQLNKKYDFLSTARCVIDLCAAPGGWLQVAAKNMPPNSVIIGVDLVAIKPIPRCITLVEDITTEKCRRSIRAEVKDWKADVVLHDGAPNVGSAWVQDAFTQVELVLASLKLAVEFLAPGGTFCTKVFRSKDYNSLMWVFNQLFNKVEATKPPSSRNVSAEIFVVCQGYLAPAKIDPKLLNAKHVFSDYDLTTTTGQNPLSTIGDGAISTQDTLTPASLNVFQPEKKRRNRDGYDEGDLTLYKECGAMEFIRSRDPIGVLGLVNRFRWLNDEDKKLFKHPLTTPDVKACVEDLKILGKKDFKNLLKWRLAVREDLGLDVKVDEAEEFIEEAEVEPIDEEEQISQELSRLAGEDAARKRRERRRVNEKKAREIQRMQLNMVTPMDIGLERQDGVDDSDMFDLGEVEGGKVRQGVQGGLSAFATTDRRDDFEDEDDSEDEETAGAGSRRRRQHAAMMDTVEEDEEGLDSDDEDERRTRRLEASLDIAYEQYHQQKMERDARHKVKEERRKRDAAEGGEWTGINDKGDSDEEDETDLDADPAPMPSSDEDDSDDDDEAMQQDVDGDDDDRPAATAKPLSNRARKAALEAERKLKAKQGKLLTDLKVEKAADDPRRINEKSRAAKMWFDQPVFKGLAGLDDLVNGDLEDGEEDEGEDESGSDEEWAGVESAAEEDAELELSPSLASDDESEGEDLSDDDFEGARETHYEDPEMEEEADLAAQEAAEELKRQRIEELGLTTAEAMTLAQQLVNRERTKTQMIDEGFNRNMNNVGGDGLPTWFLDDEQKHFRHNVPTTKEAVAAIREKMRALNARPIKKIAEAKARKKMREIRRADKVRQKAQGVNDDDENGLTEKDKAQSIAKILAKGKAGVKPKKKEVKLVVAKGANRGIKGRPRGVKGRYKIVDPVMKKQARKEKSLDKAAKKKGVKRYNARK